MNEPNNTDPLTALRHDLLRDLPGDIKRVRNAYRRAAQQAALLREAKDFTAHQAACKAGLSHLESLIKLLRWASGSDNGANNRDGSSKVEVGEDVETLIKEARAALAGREG